MNAQGITDHSGAVAADFMPWTDIECITPLRIMEQQVLIIQVKNPQQYIDKQKGFLKKKAMEINAKHYKSPICLSANGLNCSFEVLKEAVEDGFKKYK